MTEVTAPVLHTLVRMNEAALERSGFAPVVGAARVASAGGSIAQALGPATPIATEPE
jgi:hypothetical protein